MTAVCAEPLLFEVTHAEQSVDARTGEPIVTYRMTPASARAFAELTRSNVGRKAALSIDGRVVMTPVIREPILGGSGQISGHFSFEEARAIAIRLSSGAVKLEIEIVPDEGAGK